MLRHSIVVAQSSGAQTGNGQIATGKSYLVGILITTDGSNNAVATLYNGTDNSGPKLIPTLTVPGADRLGGAMLPCYIRALDGIYLELAGTGAEAVVYYDRDR